MGSMFLVEPLPIAAVAVGPGALSGKRGSGDANLLTDDPKEVWSDNGGDGARNIDLDLGVVQSVDTLLLGFIGGAPQLRAAISSGAASYTTTQHGTHFVAPTSRRGTFRRHALVHLPEPVDARFVRFAIDTNTLSVTTIGVAAAGLAFKPFYPREWGGGRRPIDTGAVDALASGGFAVGDGVVKTSFRWTFGDLSYAEVEALHDIALNRGNRRPVILVEDTAVDGRLHERIHYGLFSRFDAYERQDASKTRWSLAIEQWV